MALNSTTQAFDPIHDRVLLWVSPGWPGKRLVSSPDVGKWHCEEFWVNCHRSFPTLAMLGHQYYMIFWRKNLNYFSFVEVQCVKVFRNHLGFLLDIFRQAPGTEAGGVPGAQPAELRVKSSSRRFDLILRKTGMLYTKSYWGAIGPGWLTHRSGSPVESAIMQTCSPVWKCEHMRYHRSSVVFDGVGNLGELLQNDE